MSRIGAEGASVLTHCSYGLPRSREEVSSGGEQIDGCCQDEELRAVLLQRELWIRTPGLGGNISVGMPLLDANYG